MVLEGKVAVVYGGGGVIGGAAARAFARNGARVFLVGRTLAKLEHVAAEMRHRNVAVVDARDEEAVTKHLDGVVREAGRVDIVLNAIGVMHVQGTPLAELSLDEFERPLHGFLRSLFVTARAAARPMTAQRSGVFLSVSTPAAKIGFAGVLGYGTTCAAIEGFSRHLAVDLGAYGIRVLCLRPDALPEAVRLGSYSKDVFASVAHRAGMTLDEMLAKPSISALKRSPLIDDVANAAVFAASDHARAMTGTVINLTCGSVLD